MRWLPVLLLAGCPSATETDDPGETVDLSNHIYRLQVGSLVITGADTGLNDLVRLFFGNEVLYRLTNVTDTGSDMELVLGYKDTTPIERNPCWDKVTLNGIALGDGTLTYGPEDLTFPREMADDLNIGGLTMDATIAADGESMSDVVLTASLDLRIAAGTGFGDPDGLCETFSGFSKPCQACPDTEVYCIDLEMTGLGAVKADVANFDDTSRDPGECDPPDEET